MGAILTPSLWHGQAAWSLETPAMRATFVPALGAKIVELYDKRSSFEWLIGPGERSFGTVPYGAVFTEQDMSGWDDMFPTIDACAYPGPGDAHGASLPDHGEVWTQHWDTAQDEPGALVMRVQGVQLPYTLQRRPHFEDDVTLVLDYQLTNTGCEPMPWLWAAHPQFVCTPGMRVHLPSSVREVFNAYPRPHLGGHGVALVWPQAHQIDGRTLWLDRMIDGDRADCHKVYMRPQDAISEAQLIDADRGVSLTLGWSAPVRYLGILVDTRLFNPDPIVALEPATAFYDDLERALRLERAPTLASGETHHWQIRIHLGSSS